MDKLQMDKLKNGQIEIWTNWNKDKLQNGQIAKWTIWKIEKLQNGKIEKKIAYGNAQVKKYLR